MRDWIYAKDAAGLNAIYESIANMYDPKYQHLLAGCKNGSSLEARREACLQKANVAITKNFMKGKLGPATYAFLQSEGLCKVRRKYYRTVTDSSSTDGALESAHFFCWMAENLPAKSGTGDFSLESLQNVCTGHPAISAKEIKDFAGTYQPVRTQDGKGKNAGGFDQNENESYGD